MPTIFSGHPCTQVHTPKLLPHHGPQRVQIMNGTESLNVDGSQPHHEARKSSTAQDGG